MIAGPTGGPAQLRSVVERGLGLEWELAQDPYALGLDALVGLALRDNPKRAQLVVSRVLGKHLPVAPWVARGAGLLLAARVASVLDRSTDPTRQDLDARSLWDPAVVARQAVAGLAGDPLVIGYCETATALGHLVAEAFAGAHYVHTTRRPDPAVAAVAGFDEEHSHAVAHVLQLRDPAVLADPDRPVVLVDDELTTGTTALNTIAALHAQRPHRHWVVATLLDLRPADARAAFAARAAELEVDVQVVAMLSGALRLPEDVLDRALDLRAELASGAPAAVPSGRGRVERLDAHWPPGLPTGGRTGLDTSPPPQEALAGLAASLARRLSGGPVLVLGTEELMWAPLRLAALLPGADDGRVHYQSTTRSPVLPADLPGYAVRRALRFPAPDDPGRESRVHNLTPADGPVVPYADVVVVVDTPAGAAAGLADRLRPWATGTVQVVSL